ncbi:MULTISPECIES: DUF1801 domain-containing protein [unclassified Rhodococcus (in: high G+C Gram-positive bacteria)]|uniref:DUF1801 domain-containing protein n=1 Tax=unclassified Rhodococcus (in: high G+C Gram-positive bacteria) TaxID=192944 RepID=UPI0006FFF6B9|nr:MULTISPECIES: DUF1801 domain-containing protein [unclassified Rhodococcus (in: high G+C Gram-positive bacteria)]KQU32054.1 hypothetical protein ASG69_21165 [Rhodococcus sp. Leaf225]KQU41221.1 hypothetical protein ASH03_18025 [Rhodococcus sp. Leaf258]
MEPSAEIDGLIARHPDWRGAALAEARRVILSVDDGIVEGWKYMGSPARDLDGPLIVGDIFKAKVKLGFQYGASLDDPEGIFNGEQRRLYELLEGDVVDEEALAGLVRAAIERNRNTKAESRTK